MALNLLIPRLEWNDLEIQGNISIGSDLITNIADTSKLKIGMLINGTGFPVDSEIIAITNATTIQIDSNSSANATNALFTIKERIDFRFPPVEDSEDQPKTSFVQQVSLSGIRQVQTNFIEYIRKLKFDFLTHEERTKLLERFFEDWAAAGREFRFYYDQDDAGFKNYELANFNPGYGRRVKKHPYFLYDFSFEFRRIKGVDSTVVPGTGGDCAMFVTGSFTAPVLIDALLGITPAPGKDRQAIFVAGDGGPIDITATPQIVAGTKVGQTMVLYFCDDTDTIQIDDGDGVSLLNGASFLGVAGSYLILMWRDDLVWAEIGRG